MKYYAFAPVKTLAEYEWALTKFKSIYSGEIIPTMCEATATSIFGDTRPQNLDIQAWIGVGCVYFHYKKEN
jgi:hypothetical protein